jgi:hypothetical protein
LLPCCLPTNSYRSKRFCCCNGKFILRSATCP